MVLTRPPAAASPEAIAPVKLPAQAVSRA